MKRPTKNARSFRKREKAEQARTANTGTSPSGPSFSGNATPSAASVQSAPHQEVVTSSPEETFDLGRAIAAGLAGPAVVLLSGDLGAGKTVLAKGIAAGLDIDPADVTSPSFTLITVHQGRLRLYHVDLYRLDGAACADLGLDEVFDDPGAVVVIEWGERLPLAPNRAMRVDIQYVNENSRKILISSGSG